MVSVFLFGLYWYVTDEEGFDWEAVNDFFHWGSIAWKFQHWWFWIDHKVQFTICIVSTHIPWVDLHKSSFSMVKLNLCFSFHKRLACPIIGYPLSISVTNTQAEVNNIGWIKKRLQLRIFSPLRLTSFTERLMFLSLKMGLASSSTNSSL